jgi:hypothetical protein
MPRAVDHQCSKEETEQRLVKILDAAFSALPKPLTDLPPADESGSLEQKRARPARRKKRKTPTDIVVA